MSDYLERHRNSYYESITKVRAENDITQWLCFFLQGIIETAEKGVNTFNSILELEKKNEEIIQTMGSRSANAMMVIKELYIRPIIDAKRVSGLCNITLTSAYNLIADLEEKGILSEVTGGRRGRLYAMQAYLALFN